MEAIISRGDRTHARQEHSYYITKRYEMLSILCSRGHLRVLYIVLKSYHTNVHRSVNIRTYKYVELEDNLADPK